MGLRATVNSDDPAYFGGYLNDNYRAVAAARNLTREQIARLARNSITGSFLPQQAKDAHLATIDAYLEQAH
jgi:adenosine deaminase